MKKIRALGGLDVPLNVVLFQEIQRLQRVIHKVRVTLKAIRQAIDGEVVMTQELLTNIGELFNATTPNTWVYTPAGDEFSWISSTVGLWFGLLTGRFEQNNKWLTVGRPVTYWLHGFANPLGSRFFFIFSFIYFFTFFCFFGYFVFVNVCGFVDNFLVIFDRLSLFVVALCSY